LVEILIAVAIIAIGALASINMHIYSIKGNSVALNMTFATAIAESELERLKSLPFDEVKGKSDYVDANLNQMSQPCGSGMDCSRNIFTRRVKFYHRTPTNRSTHVEVEINWKDSAGDHAVFYETVVSTMDLS
jgi:Tfp pilus assembly protein PilV